MLSGLLFFNTAFHRPWLTLSFTSVCAISIIRISKIATLDSNDITWRFLDVWVWTVLENSVGVTSACLPTMRECNSLPNVLSQS